MSLTTVETERAAPFVARIAELGPTFAARAERYDREASFPYENFADLRDIGFLGLCIPERFGGLGADFTTYALVAEEIGRHCGSTALTFNMHTATCLLAGEVADQLGLPPDDAALLETRRARLYADILTNGTIHSQPFSEGLSGRATSGIATTATPVEGGYRVDGRKIFASLSEAAGIHDVVCLVPGDERVRLLGVPAGADGVTITGDWDPLGMRGTISKTLLFDDVFVPADNEWVPPGVFDQVAARWPWFYMTLSFAYLGVSRSALDLTRAYLRGEVDGTSRAAHPQKQAVWAEMQLKHHQARALCHAVLADITVDPHPDLVARAWASMITTMETAPEVASLAIRACGGRSILRPLPLERIFRDARCGATMLPWSVEVCLDRLGRYGLDDGDGTFA
ncbi:MAG TPA: acyl-CoA dehydrogenase family protein [Acidimicrobiales bacterium]|nr:acyl-CoA dehydrogenase family protein [Acidimicrobiales bacterium]